MAERRGTSAQEPFEAFLADLFLNLSAVLIVATAAVAAFGVAAQDAGVRGPVFLLCPDRILSVGTGEVIAPDRVLGSDFAEALLLRRTGDPAPVLRIGAGAETVAFLFTAHAASRGAEKFIVEAGRCA